MSAEETSGEKEFEPTEHKLAEQRRKGEVARSTDMHTAAAFLGLLLAAVASGYQSVMALGDLGIVLLGQADRLSGLVAGRAQPPMAGILLQTGLAVAPFFVLPLVFVLGSLFAQQAMIAAPEKLMPKISRISLIENAKQKFGRTGLFEFAKASVKLALVTALLWLFGVAHLDTIIGSMTVPVAQASAEMLRLLVLFLGLVVLSWAAIGAIDYLWQRAEHLRQNRMSHQELRDEMKQTEGDPHAKGERQRRGREIASNRMLEAVAGANVVIVNPTHYAVALKWDATSPGAPICVAKGVDEIAAQIRARARAANVPIHSDPVTARALYATVRIDQEIQPEHYAAVAAAIRFAQTIRARARQGAWG